MQNGNNKRNWLKDNKDKCKTIAAIILWTVALVLWAILFATT